MLVWCALIPATPRFTEFVPTPGDKQRSTERELQIKAVVGTELPIEEDLERWFPLWGIPI